MDVARRMKPRHIMGVDIDPALIHKVWQMIRALLACDIALRMRTARLSRACIVNGVTDTIERCVARLRWTPTKGPHQFALACLGQGRREAQG